MKTDEFKKRFNEAITSRNMKPIELSQKTGLSKSTISHYMSGYAKPKSDKLYMLAKALDVNEAWLMGLDVPMERINPELLELQKKSRKAFSKEWNIQFFENKMLSLFSLLNDENKKKSITYTENLLSLQKLEDEAMSDTANEQKASKQQEKNTD